MLAQKVISRVGRNPDVVAPEGTKPHPKDDNYFNLFNLLEDRPTRKTKLEQMLTWMLSELLKKELILDKK